MVVDDDGSADFTTGGGGCGERGGYDSMCGARRMPANVDVGKEITLIMVWCTNL